MFHLPLRLLTVLALPLVLVGCILTPGKFTSTLTINADRTFTYTYVGEVYAVDFGKEMARSLSKVDDDDKPDPATAAKEAKQAADKKAEFDRKARTIAAALAKEAGYRRAEYVGDGKFLIDYSITSVLTHNFVYPFNADAEAIIPFIAIELRADGKARVKAPGFSKDGGESRASSMGGMGGMPSAGGLMDGTFTLDTNAELVSQNNEAGATNVGGRKRVVWAVNAATETAPMAVVGFR